MPPARRKKVGPARYESWAVLGRNLKVRGKKKWRILSFVPAEGYDDAIALFKRHQRANYDPKEGWEFDAKRIS